MAFTPIPSFERLCRILDAVAFHLFFQNANGGALLSPPYRLRFYLHGKKREQDVGHAVHATPPACGAFFSFLFRMPMELLRAPVEDDEHPNGTITGSKPTVCVFV